MTRGAVAQSGSAYRAALDGTVQAVGRRARNFRNLIVAVVVVALAVIVVSALSAWPRGVAAILVLVPVCGGFLARDQRIVSAWRGELLDRWSRGELELAAFREAVRAHPGLPGNALEAMLFTLPATADLGAEQRVQYATRAAVAAVSHAMHRRRADALLLDVAASALVVGALLAALWLRRWTPLLALALLALRPAAGAWLRRGRTRAARAQVEARRGDPGFDDENYQRLLVGLP